MDGRTGPESSGGGALSSAKRSAGGASLGLARAGVDEPQSPMKVGPSPFPPEARRPVLFGFPWVRGVVLGVVRNLTT